MNKRQQEILQVLLSESNEYLLVKELADRVECSEKTIRNDFKVIEGYLEQYSDALLIRRPGLGVCLEIKDYDKSSLFNKLYAVKQDVGYSSDEERVLQIAYSLLMNVKPVTVKVLAEQYFVNRATVKKDLDRIETWLEELGLDLVVKQRIGLTVGSDERSKRKALAKLSDLINNRELMNQFIKNQFLYHEIEFVMTELKALQQRYGTFFTDDTLENLLLHTLIMVRRMKLKQPISMSKDDLNVVQETKEYGWTLDFLTRLEFIFTVHFTEEEVAYLAIHILGGKFRYQDGWERSKLNVSSPVLSQIVSYLIDRMSRLNEIDFEKDTYLLEGLQMHLYTTLNRLQYNLSVSNPMLHEIKRMYPYMFDMLIHELDDINKSLSLQIPEEEAAYLTLHFQAAMDRLSDKKVSKNVIIVCHMGIGISQLLRTKIERKFRYVHVMDCIAKSDLEGYLMKNKKIELIISTIDLPRLNIPHFVVSPLLERSEESKLEDFMKKLDELPSNGNKDFALLNYTTPFLVFLQQELEHRYELIERLARSLYEKGYVEKEYIESAIARDRMSATTIGAGVSIPHGSPKLIKQSAIAVATLREPLDWGVEKVSLVFMLAVKSDGKEVTKQLFHELSFISEQPVFVQKLIKETNIMKFLSYLRYE
ncbi:MULTISPECIES: BglG family transcription antiterminator [Bacillus]|uniref:BglG family transcription antiterminator n=1 Tax=Bacillus TaxID=1386 RepID=UPI0009233FC0|nr:MULTISPECIES: BglG family transcription antiterminator [Bacillus]MED3265104.1 BglG family transcription antiterminator [Bacillus thuringiensis]PFA91656.1 PTS sugar transporter subunit IIA [Bacillus thuringiensis]PFB40655.1 PTS sugar transporter subunit IIA [Bacillus thuringiensis]PFE90416.1 PTS sugar transporter subunit IIA [Bacillus thuringiensis]PFV40412.1 PTS sugar transporter subunit IIA [Bacillus thuringiensis]